MDPEQLAMARAAQQKVEASPSPVTFGTGQPQQEGRSVYDRAYAAVDAVMEELIEDPNLYKEVQKQADGSHGGAHKNMRYQIDGMDEELAAMLGKDPDMNNWSDEDFKDLARMNLSLISSTYDSKVYKHMQDRG